MPTYEYTCKRCGETIEVFQSFSEKPLRKHRECGGELKKVFHARGVVFKGSGFYSTDSRSSTSSKKSDKGEPAKKGESSKGDAKGDKSSKSESSPKAASSSASSD